MPLSVTYGNALDRLVDRLAADVAAYRADAGLLEPVWVAVPSRRLAGWLFRQLAARHGVAAHLRPLRIDELAAEVVAALPERPRLVAGTALFELVLAELVDDAALADLWAAPLRAYVFPPGADEGEADVRRVQLARRIARLFEQYIESRPDLIEAWSRAPAEAPDAGAADVDAWQRHLWRRVRARAGERATRTGRPWRDLREIVAGPPPAPPAIPARVFAFGLSYFAPLVHRLFHWLASTTAVCVYAFNPCREYWEDAGGPAPRDGDDPFGLDREDENPLLRRWGRPGREHIRLLNEASRFDFAEAFVAPPEPPPTLLAAVQRDVLDRRLPSRDGRALRSDTSLRVLACPTVARECEIVAGEIWRLLREDRTLRMSDIAVYVASRDRDVYYTHLASAFRAAHELPYQLVDAPLASRSAVVDAVRALVALPASRFERGALLGVMAHPAVLGGFAGASADAWLRMCDDTGIVHGADRRDHADTYLDGDRFHWDQGIVRLALGAFMAGPRSGDERAVAAGAHSWLPEERPPDERVAAAQFGLLARSLIADARFARRARMTLSDWAEFWSAVVATYVHAADDRDERDRLRCLARIRDLADLDLDGARVGYDAVRELLDPELAALTGAVGSPLGDGVTIAALGAAHAVPHRAVFVVGLGEGHFPAPARADQLDLRLRRRRAGDVSPRDRDRYAFLETLMAARERLVLSYVARDVLTGDALEPSSVVVELMHVLRGGYLGDAVADLVDVRPLRRYDDDRDGAIPEAGRERAARRARADLLAAVGSDRVPERRALAAALSTDAWARLADLLGVAPLPDPADAERAGPIDVPLAAVRRFLECPLQGSARFLLRLVDDDDDDLLAREDEPFALDRLDTIVLLREAFAESLRRREPLGAVYAERLAVRQMRGCAPAGVFAESLREQHIRVLKRWRERYKAIPADGPLTVVRFGRGGEFDRADRIEPAIELAVPAPAGGDVTVRLSGQASGLAPSLAGTVVLARRAPKGRRPAPRDVRDMLRAWIDQVALAAAGIKAGAPHGAYVCVATAGADALRSATLRGLSRDEAVAYLRDVVADMLAGVHPYLFPFEAAWRVYVGNKEPAEA
ncbi:MAG: hypothetical protein D6689_15975, partial [Deltaproteobacteria bacterium]